MTGLSTAVPALAFLLLVFWIGSRWGRAPAIGAAILAFLAFDYFFVPPYGTLAVGGTSGLADLILLLAGALFGGQLAARLRRDREAAESAAADTQTLYEVAVEALRAADATSALKQVCEAAVRLGHVSRFSALAALRTSLEQAAGDPVDADGLKLAAWAHANQQPLGLRLSGGRLALMEQPEGRPGPACLPVAGGVVVMEFAERPPAGEELRLLAALTALAGLLLDRRRAALEEERRRSVEASDQLKAAVLSSLSHELRSPLASLRLGLSGLSMAEAGLRPDQRELVAGLDAQAARLDRLVGDLLALSRLEAGAELKLRPTSFPELVGAVSQRMAQDLGRFRLELDVPDLPPVMGDELQLDRLLTNLLQNAIEWTPAGGRIAVSARVQGSQLEAAVENEGPEIPPNDLQSIFDKFWTGRAHGTGLGLAICKRVVEAHGGRIEARNLRGGPRLTFTLPLAPVAAEVRR